MPIRQHLPDHHAFEPDQIATMSKALEETCAALGVFSGDHQGRETVAARIIDLARNGVLDPNALRDRVIREAKSIDC
jgi:hypothetical protein